MGLSTNATAWYGMQAIATPDGIGISGSQAIGVGDTALSLTGLTVAYALQFQVAVGVTATLDLTSGAVTGATSGVAQVETATVVAAAGCTSNGNLALVVTIAGVAIPVTVALTTATHTSDALIAAAIRTAFNATAAITAAATVGGSGADVTLTLPAAANDATLNIAITAGLGVSAITSSVDTTAGVQATKIYRIAGQTYDTKDFQGVTLGSLSTLKGLLIVHESGFTECIFANSGKWEQGLNESEIALKLTNTGMDSDFLNELLEFTATTASAFKVYVLGS